MTAANARGRPRALAHHDRYPQNVVLADIYLSEFMRLFTHFRFRYWSQHAPTIAAGLIAPDDQGRVLKPDSSWATEFYDPASRWCRERETFRAPPP